MLQNARPSAPAEQGVLEEVEVDGHIIDSLILPKLLDCISANGGTFRVRQIQIGQRRSDPSHALVEVHTADRNTLRSASSRFACSNGNPAACNRRG